MRTPYRGFGSKTAAASASVIVLTFFVLMHPGERFYGQLPITIFAETGAHPRQVGPMIFYNTLMLPGERLIDDEDFKKLEIRNNEKRLEPWEGERSIAKILSYRDFSHANFDSIDLRKVDLKSTVLDYAQLNSASLQGASLEEASLREADFSYALLQGVSLDQAFAQGADMDSASLHGASFVDTRLQGATFEFASLHGANLRDAWLHGVSFKNANLQGATLSHAKLYGAQMDYASLQGARLNGASLQGVSFESALIEATLFSGSAFDSDPLGDLEDLIGHETMVWRSRGSTHMELAKIDALDFSKIDSIAYESLLLEALLDVPDSTVEKIKSAVSVLDPTARVPKDEIDWLQIQKSMSAQTKFKARYSQSLAAIACEADGAPYVAKGIMRSYLDASFDGEALPLVKKLLAGCAGAKDLDGASIDRLLYRRQLLIPAPSSPEEMDNK